MNSELYSRLNYELKILKDAREKCSHRLSLLGDVRNKKLRINKVNENHIYYYIGNKGTKDFKYIGSGVDARVQNIKEAVHLEESLERIDKNISLITSLLDDYSEYDYASVDMILSAAYKAGRKTDTTALFGPCFSYGQYRDKAQKWKKAKLIYQATFPENYPENKTEQASDGTRMKTLSEVLIYERLLSAGLISVYELPLVSADYGPNMYPDFTVLSPIDLQTEIIIEYVGRLDLQPYREDFAKRINRYIQNGYIPGVNLFFIFGDKRGHVDSLQISKVIADIKGIR